MTPKGVLFDHGGRLDSFAESVIRYELAKRRLSQPVNRPPWKSYYDRAPEPNMRWRR
jgi:hypothetical protein